MNSNINSPDAGAELVSFRQFTTDAEIHRLSNHGRTAEVFYGGRSICFVDASVRQACARRIEGLSTMPCTATKRKKFRTGFGAHYPRGMRSLTIQRWKRFSHVRTRA